MHFLGHSVLPTNCNVGLHTLRRCFVTFSSLPFSSALCFNSQPNGSAEFVAYFGSMTRPLDFWGHIEMLSHYSLSLSVSLWSITSPCFSHLSNRSTKTHLNPEISGERWDNMIQYVISTCLVMKPLFLLISLVFVFSRHALQARVLIAR